jgi:hypothetical protein
MSTTLAAAPNAQVRFLVPVAGDRWLDISSSVRRVDYNVWFNTAHLLDDTTDWLARDHFALPPTSHCHVELAPGRQGADLMVPPRSVLRVVASAPADTKSPWPWTFSQDFTIDTVSIAPEEAP